MSIHPPEDTTSKSNLNSENESRLWTIAKICALLGILLPPIFITIYDDPNPTKALCLYAKAFVDSLIEPPKIYGIIILLIFGFVTLLSHLRPSSEKKQSKNFHSKRPSPPSPLKQFMQSKDWKYLKILIGAIISISILGLHRLIFCGLLKLDHRSLSFRCSLIFTITMMIWAFAYAIRRR